jgi:hypothetical protein
VHSKNFGLARAALAGLGFASLSRYSRRKSRTGGVGPLTQYRGKSYDKLLPTGARAARTSGRIRMVFILERRTLLRTLIRHATPYGTITATSGGVHGATTWSSLIAPPSFPLLNAAGFLRAGSKAIALAPIALLAD